MSRRDYVSRFLDSRQRAACQRILSALDERGQRTACPAAPSLLFCPLRRKAQPREIRVWAREAWGIFCMNVAINTAKLVRCQLSGVHDPEIQKEFVDIIMSEVGYVYFQGSPRPVVGHRALFLRFGEAIGIPQEELERCEKENDFLPKIGRASCRERV